MPSYSTIASKITYVGSAAFATQMQAAFQLVYEGSALAAAAVDAWLATHPGTNIVVEFLANNAAATPGGGHVFMDPAFPAGNYYIDENGNKAEDTIASCFAHELCHAVTGLTDNPSPANTPGDNVTAANTWFQQLGFAEQASYEAYDPSGVTLTSTSPGSYTFGEAIVNAFVDFGGQWTSTDGSWTFDTRTIDAKTMGVTGDTLIVGGTADNTYTGTTSKDYIYGGDGEDMLDGDAGNDFLSGGTGIDHLNGGDDSDILQGGPGTDVLDGGAGHDILSYRDATSFIGIASVGGAMARGISGTNPATQSPASRKSGEAVTATSSSSRPIPSASR